MTVSASSLDSGSVEAGFGTSQSFDTASVTAPAHSLLALWLTDNDGLEPSVSGLSLTWTKSAEVSYTAGHLVLMTAEVGSSSATGTIAVSYTGAQGAVAYDLDCVSGDDGETPSFGASGSFVTNFSNGTGNASVEFSGPAFYLFGSAASSSGNFSASPGESPAWTQLAFEQGYTSGGAFVAVALETQVSPDTSNPEAITDWSASVWDGGWGAIGVPITA